MPSLRRCLCLTVMLALTGCSLPGGLVYDPNRGLITDKQSGNNPAAEANGTQGGMTLGEMFGGTSGPANIGYVAGDEPYAVKAAADILAQGGSAADAVTAMYFTMAVTYPGAAGLGGGGLCVAYDSASGRAESFDFLVRNAAGAGAYGVPGNASGFAALQHEFGTQPWAHDVANAEALAATGFPISAALEKRLVAAQNVIRLDAVLAREFLDESGKVKPAGTMVTAPELAATLAELRQQGGGALYRGQIAEAIVKYAAGEGGALSLHDLAAYRADRSAPQRVMLDTRALYLPPQSVGAGAFGGAVMNQLYGADNQPLQGDAAQIAHVALERALARFSVPALPQDLGSTGFAALDKNGQAVACAVTMNGPFGSGHTVPGTGLSLARTPASPALGLAAAFLMPAILTRDVTGPIRLPDEAASYTPTLAAAGAGGPDGTAAIAYSVLKLARNEGLPAPEALLRAHANPFDTLDGVACANGLCSVIADKSVGGLGVAAQATAPQSNP